MRDLTLPEADTVTVGPDLATDTVCSGWPACSRVATVSDLAESNLRKKGVSEGVS